MSEQLVLASIIEGLIISYRRALVDDEQAVVVAHEVFVAWWQQATGLSLLDKSSWPVVGSAGFFNAMLRVAETDKRGAREIAQREAARYCQEYLRMP